MEYQVLARKWRPQTFAELVGQEKVLAALSHGLAENRLHHAYLFTGTRGVGKTTVARILAKSLNCEQGISANPCGVCEACNEIREGRYVDLVEIDAASRTKVEDTRELLDHIQYAPAKGRFKVYLIDEVHMLSTHSFNALLKTLEEPPEHVKFLLATTDPQKLPVTVLSRCMQFHLKNIPTDLIVTRLSYILQQEHITFEDEALSVIAKAAEGSLRDALSLTDQAIGQGEGQVKTATTLAMLGIVHTELLYELAECLAQQNNAALLVLLEKIAEAAIDYSYLLKLFAEFWYEVSLKQMLPAYQSLDWNTVFLQNFATTLSASLVQLFYEMAIQGRKTLPFAPEPKIGFNMTILRMLSFRPVNLTALQASTNTPPKADPQKRPEPVSKPALSESHTQTPTQSQPTPELQPRPQSLAMAEKIALENWEMLLSVLPLSGMLKQIVKNTVFDHLDGNMLVLKIDQTHQALFNAQAQNKLIEALQKYYDRPFSLQIIGSEQPLESPAVKDEAARQAQDLQVQEKLAQDTNIDFIKNNFNAKIVSAQLN